MSLLESQKATYASVPLSSVGILAASSNTGTLGSDTNGVTIFTATSKGGRVTSLLGSTNDTVTVNVFLYILDGSNVMPLGLVNIPLSSGNTAAAATMVDMLATIPGLPLDNQGKRYISLGPNDVLKATALANLTAAKSAWLTAQGSNIDPT